MNHLSVEDVNFSRINATLCFRFQSLFTLIFGEEGYFSEYYAAFVLRAQHRHIFDKVYYCLKGIFLLL